MPNVLSLFLVSMRLFLNLNTVGQLICLFVSKSKKSGKQTKTIDKEIGCHGRVWQPVPKKILRMQKHPIFINMIVTCINSF